MVTANGDGADAGIDTTTVGAGSAPEYGVDTCMGDGGRSSADCVSFRATAVDVDATEGMVVVVCAMEGVRMDWMMAREAVGNVNGTMGGPERGVGIGAAVGAVRVLIREPLATPEFTMHCAAGVPCSERTASWRSRSSFANRTGRERVMHLRPIRNSRRHSRLAALD